MAEAPPSLTNQLTHQLDTLSRRIRYIADNPPPRQYTKESCL